jgi:hypothetical protein
VFTHTFLSTRTLRAQRACPALFIRGHIYFIHPNGLTHTTLSESTIIHFCRSFNSKQINLFNRSTKTMRYKTMKLKHSTDTVNSTDRVKISIFIIILLLLVQFTSVCNRIGHLISKFIMVGRCKQFDRPIVLLCQRLLPLFSLLNSLL